MKKSILFLACCIGLMLFASCKKDPIAPTINILADADCVSENAQVYSGDEIQVGFTGTAENLTQIDVVISQDGTVLASLSDNMSGQKDEPVPPFTYKHAFTIEAVGIVTITGTATDANGLTASKSFNVIYEEKPYEKFLGTYEGNTLFTGIIRTQMQGQEPMEQEVTDFAMPVKLSLSGGENPNEVQALWKMESQEMTVTGTVDGDKVSFEVVDFPYTFNYQYQQGFNIPITFTVTYTINGTLNGEQLDLDGTCKGSGNIILISATAEIDGTIGGSLTKTR